MPKRKPVNMRFFLPIIEALKSLGESGTNAEIKDFLIETQKLKESELEEKLKNGILRIDNQITWAKIYLRDAGFIETTDKNILKLTESGKKANLSEDQVVDLIRDLHSRLVTKGRRETESPTEEIAEHKEILLTTILSLPPNGFERLCQRFLRESGFTKVVVKGKSGDGGIDGEGILEINPLVSLKVIFQSKRYKDSVSSSQVRDFRGAMQGRAEKGIIITTGRFTQDAKKEAMREGVPPIELVDGEKLVALFEQKEIGLRKKTIYEVDQEFFNEFK